MNEVISNTLRNLPKALVEPTAWGDVLKGLCAGLSASHSFISERDKSGTLLLPDEPWTSEFVYGYGGESGILPYLEYYRDFDVWDGFEEVSHKKATAVLVSHARGYELDKRSEFREWLDPLDITDNAYMKLFDTPSGSVGINVHFHQTSTECSQVLTGLNDVGSLIGSSLKLQQLGLTANSQTIASMDASPSAQLLLAADGRVVHINAKAENLARVSPHVIKVNGNIGFAVSSVQQAFEACLHDAVVTRLPQVLALQAREVGEQTTVVLSPVEASRTAFFLTETHVLMTFVGAEHHAPLIEPFAKSYGLTPRQTSILYEVDKGKGVQQIATDLGLSHHYVRDVLYKNIFPILGVTDMRQLVAKLGHLHRSI